MKRFLPGLAALLAGVLLLSLLGTPVFSQQTGPPNQILCGRQAIATISSATTTSLIAGVSTTSIMVCGWHVTTSNASNPSTFQLVYGTQGGPCSSPTSLTPAFSVTSTAPSSDHIEFATIQVPLGQQLCVVSTGATVQLAVLVYYSQF